MSDTATDESLNGYSRYAASHVAGESRPVLVAESFSGLMAVRWASKDPHVAGVPIVLAHFEDDLVVGAEARVHLESVCHNAVVVRVPGPHFAIEIRPRESAAAIRGPLAAMFGRSPMPAGRP